MPMKTRILVCRCKDAAVAPEGAADAVIEGLREAGVAFEVIDDMCGAAARRHPGLQTATSGELRVAACFPRAVKWLLYAGGSESVDGNLKVMNMRTLSVEDVLAGLSAEGAPEKACCSTGLERAPKDDWTPWFPVIDYERCTNCKQCLSFCLFGVFAVDADGMIKVENPRQCKTNCPACSRVCPQVAIMFPKYDKRPINGDEVRPEDTRRGAVKLDVGGMMEGDVHAKLRERNRKARERFATNKDRETDRASCGCSLPNAAAGIDMDYLRKMREELDIPEEVLQGMGGGCACSCGGADKDETPAEDAPKSKKQKDEDTSETPKDDEPPCCSCGS